MFLSQDYSIFPNIQQALIEFHLSFFTTSRLTIIISLYYVKIIPNKAYFVLKL